MTIPPRAEAAAGREAWLAQRNASIARIRDMSRTEWKREVEYHRRSLVETAFFRLKTIFGDRLSARKFKRQAAEATIRCLALNRMTRLGMPDSYLVR